MCPSSAPPYNAQRWFPDRYAAHGRFVADLAEPLLVMLEARPGERILDIGCGDGALTEKIAAAGAAVVGVDFSAEQIEAARARGLDAHVADGQKLEFDGEFDGILTNAALHWMKDADAVIDGMWRALKPGGRLVGEMGGQGNVARVSGALMAAMERRGLDSRAAWPWYFPGPDEYRAKLEARGFRVDYIELIPRPTPLPADIAGWFETFGEAFLLAAPEDQRATIIDEAREALRPELQDEDGNWTADYVRLRFAAVRPDDEAG
jgi:trans-aconitate methyltransferase